jgi:DNA-binding MltR family transcriptional regulator
MQAVDLNAFGERLSSESDRACAVLGAALLDAKLEHVFRRKLRCFHDQLLGNTRPIGTFSARIRLARALDWINEDVRADLDVVRDIRNDFAHSFDHNLAFSDQSVSARCGNLRTAQAYIDGYELAANSPHRNLSPTAIYAMQAVFKPPRWRYQLAVDFLAQHLDEIAAGVPAYCGTDLLAEVGALSASARVQVSIAGTVERPSQTATGEEDDGNQR